MTRYDVDLTPEQWRRWEAQNDAEDRDRAEAFDRFREDAEQFMADAAVADTHSSDVDPGRVDPWAER